ncbi:MAG: cation transporter, partial [Candidatus Parcubacteria bacterium]|nr:cation transporter [Candidatus Parcubacteria bacterium]
METKKTFLIKGMHCASCVVLLEDSLKKVDGVVKATVNLLDEKATVIYDSEKVTDQHLAGAVLNAGYKALIDGEQKHGVDEKAEKQKELHDLKIKVMVSLFLGGLIFWGSFPGLMNTAPMLLQNFWVQLILSIPVQFWAGWSFYRATVFALKHRTANMDTLVAIGTTVAFGYSVFVTTLPQLVESIGIDPMPYFDV